MAAYTMHSLDRRDDRGFRPSSSKEKTPPPPLSFASTATVWSSSGGRPVKSFQPVHFDVTTGNTQPKNDLSNMAEISKLLPTPSRSASADMSMSKVRRSNTIGGNRPQKSSYTWKSSSSSPPPAADRRKLDIATTAAQSVLRGFRNLRDFWMSPKTSRRSIDDEDEVEDQKIPSKNERPSEIFQKSSLPHVLEQPSPAEEIPLPSNVRRFTMDEFTKTFGPCRQAFSLPSSPFRRKRLSTTSTTSSTTEPEVILVDVGNSDIGEFGSPISSAATTPSMQRRVTFRLEDESDAESVGDGVHGEPSSSSAVWSLPDQHRGSLPHTAREMSRLRGPNSLSSIRESLPFNSDAAKVKPRVDWQTVNPESGNNSAFAKKCATFDGRTVKSQAKINLIPSSAVSQQQPPQLQQRPRPAVGAVSSHQPGTKPSHEVDKQVITTSIPTEQNNPREPKTGEPMNISFSSMRHKENGSSGFQPVTALPSAPDPLITLLSATRGPVMNPNNRASDFPTVQANSLRKSSTGSLPRENGNRIKTTFGTDSAASEDDDLSYKDWYRKVFNSLHKMGDDLGYVANHDISDGIPRRPSAAVTTEAQSNKRDDYYSSATVSQPEDSTDLLKRSSVPRETSKDTKILVKSSKSKSFDATAMNSAIPTPDETHRTVEKFELGVSARIAAQNNAAAANKDRSRNQSPKLNGIPRSMQEPCKIVKPEDGTLLSDEYWLEFAKELDRERQPRNYHTVTSDTLKSSRDGSLDRAENYGKDGSRVLRLSQKFIIPPHQYDFTPFKKPKPSTSSKLPSADTRSSSNSRSSSVGRARAVYTFVASDDKEISFTRGDIIDVIRQVDKNWFEGQVKGKRGLVPSNYVELLPQKDDRLVFAEDADKDVRVVALHNFTAQAPDELSIKKGDVVTVIRNVDDNWYEGRLNGRQGMFPVNYVERLNEADCLSQTTSSLQDQMSSPPSDTDLCCSPQPVPSSFPDRVHTFPRFNHAMDPQQSYNDRNWVPVNSSSFRQQQPPETKLPKGSRYPHKEQLFIAIGNHDSYDSCTDVAEQDDEQHYYGNGGGTLQRSSTLVSSPSPRRVKFNVDQTHADSTRGGRRGPDMNSGQRQGSIPPQYEPSSNTWRRVLYDYNPRHDDELALKEGDLVSVIRCFDDGWCVGMLSRTKKIGTFPGNYLQ